MNEDEEPLDGAIGAVRVGSSVRKVSGPWTPSVHALLRFMLDAGFDLVPVPQGLDDRGREVLSWLEGTPGYRPWPAALLSDEGVVELAGVLRRYHNAVRFFDPGPDATWRAGQRGVRDGEIVCHGDFGPWNTVWRDESVVGVIDWDMAEPDDPIMDVAFLALQVVPLRSDDYASNAGFGSMPPRGQRLRVLCEAYGDVRPEDVLDTVTIWHRRDRYRTTTWGANGREPWSTFLHRGDLRLIDGDESWLNAHGGSLL